jgi:hypothetical protein
MNNNQIMDSISQAFANLADVNAMIYDYWIAELYNDGEMIDCKWNEHTLKLMEDDVMMQQQLY